MKLTRDNYEFLLFELLEGNLDDQSAAQLLDQIDSDSFYAHEWRLMQKTVLNADDGLVFKGKNNLYKPTGANILALMPLMKYAAAAVLIIATLGGLKWMLSSDSPDLGSENNYNDMPVADESFIADRIEDERVPVSEDKETQMITESNVPASKYIHKVEFVPAVKEQDDIKMDKDLAFNPVVINGVQNIVSPNPMEKVSEINISPIIYLPPIPENHVVQDNQSMGIRQRINNSLNEILGPYRNPKLEITKAEVESSKLAFNISLTSAEFSSNTLVLFKR